jgi:hypothetical protein
LQMVDQRLEIHAHIVAEILRFMLQSDIRV